MHYDPSDEEIMSQLKAGNIDALDILFTRYQEGILNFIFRILGDFHKSQDIMQEAFVRVFRYAHRYDQSFKFLPWLYGIARNLCLSEIHKQEKAEILFANIGIEDQPVQLMDEKTPYSELETMELEQIVGSDILRLSERQREVFILRENQMLSYEEISQVTNLSISAVKSHLHRARMNLKEMLIPYLRSGKV